MLLNKILIYAGVFKAKNTGIGKYSSFLIDSLEKFNPQIIYIKNKNIFLRISEEILMIINSIFYSKNVLTIYSSERDLPFALLSRSKKKNYYYS